MSRRRAPRATIAGLLSVMLVACTDGGLTAPTTVPPTIPGSSLAPASSVSPPGLAKWTAVVFLAADNDLERASLLDAMEMTAPLSSDLNLIVVHDRSPIGEERDGFTAAGLPVLGDWNGTRAYQVTPGGFVDLGIQQDADMTNPGVYEALTAQVLAQFPSEHQALFFWSHGGAWQGSGMDDTSNPGAIMGTDALADGIGRALQSVGDDRVDLVVYDSCLMGELSAASAFSDVASYLLASEESVPGHSLNYADLATAAQAASPLEFGTTLLTGFMQHATEYGTVDSVTMSLIDLAGVTEMNVALGELASASSNLSGADAIAMMRAINSTVSFGGGRFFMSDLGQYSRLAVTGNPAVDAALGRVAAAVDAMVVAHDEGIQYEGATGLAAYLPPTITEFDTRYTSVGGLSAVWGQFLDNLYNAGADEVASTPLAFSEPTQTAWNGEFLATAAAVDPAVATGLVNRTAFLGLDSTEGIVTLYSTPIPEIDELVTIGGQYRPAAWTLITADGSVTQLVTLSETSIDMTAELLVGTVPVIYIAPSGEQTQMYMAVSIRADAPDDALPNLQLYAMQENGSLGPFTPDPAGTLDALVGTFLEDGTAAFRSNGDLFDAAPLPADLSQLRFVGVPIEAGAVDLLGLPLVTGVRIVDGSGDSLVSWANVT